MAISSTLIKSFQLSTLATALALAGCGGGSGNDTLQPGLPTGTNPMPSPGNGTGTNPAPGNGTGTNPTTPPSTDFITKVQKVLLVGNGTDFYMNLNDSIELNVYALDSNNVGVANVPVNIKITDPALTGVFSNTPQTLNTDASGKASIKLDIKSLTKDQKTYLKNTGLAITSTVGKQSDTKTLKGTDTKVTTPPVLTAVKDLLLVSDAQSIKLLKGTKIKVTSLAVDKNNNIIPNTLIDFNIGNSTLSGVFANQNLSVPTNDRGEATLELELKSLSDEQKSYLMSTGLVITSTSQTSNINSNSLTLKGVAADTNDSQRFDVKAVNLTTPKANFNIKVGEKFTVTASVLDTNNLGIGGVPVQFKLADAPSVTGIYSVSDLSNVITNAKGEATIELEVKSEAFRDYLVNKGINIQATAKNTVSAIPEDKTAQLNIKGVTLNEDDRWWFKK